jgi:hypothetical protein
MNMETLLTPGKSSPKLSHMNGMELESVVMYLAPSTMVDGINTCAAASPFCRELCLYASGHVEIERASGRHIIEACRKRRTEWFRDDVAGFMKRLVQEVANLEKRAAKNGKQPVCRLNGTSDILWEHIPVTRDIRTGKHSWDVGVSFPNIMTAFPNVQFYDYTKVPSRIKSFTDGRLPANYHLTFSLSESNDRIAARALESGMNVAVPMHITKHQPPATWSGYPVIDGDLTDYRFADPQGGYIVALSPKGSAAKKDTTSGFIRFLSDTLDTSRVPTFAR